MSKRKLTAEATITYVTPNKTFDIDTNISEGQIADQQAAFWKEIGSLPAGRRGQTILPREAEVMEAYKKKKSRSTQPQYLNYR